MDLKNQAASPKFSCLDAVSAELHHWTTQLITDQDRELPLSDLGIGIFYISDLRTLKNSAPLQCNWLKRIHNEQKIIDGTVVKEPKIVCNFFYPYYNFVLLWTGSELVYHRLPCRLLDSPYAQQVLYEDAVMIAFNKPSGLQVLPGGFFQQQTVSTEFHWLWILGILLCAKSKLARTHLAAYFADGTSCIRGIGTGGGTKVKYKRNVGKITLNEVITEQPIGTVLFLVIQGTPALMKVEVLESDMQGNCTLAQVEIESGRPHQARIHISFIEHPSLDPHYIVGCGQPKVSETTKPVPGECGYYLHAHQLILLHPTTNEFSANAPLNFIFAFQLHMLIFFLVLLILYRLLNFIPHILQTRAEKTNHQLTSLDKDKSTEKASIIEGKPQPQNREIAVEK
ncbi:hypothetical protein P3X46_033951 [Hevea brasiliensis]|uniref:Pseudouridine synthase RsuA/RluA-like domain-containing protein n=1 Tax=Hevea brasiliensis TaxID=3981 RepID=A0ABQ9K9J7_HEVBR|nr:hypothetical protein P3X46_033951 [Hevea brasiliensis]